MRNVIIVACVAVVGCGAAAPTAPVPAVTHAIIPVGAINIVPVPAQLPTGGGSLQLVIATLTSEGANLPAPRAHVDLTASSGTLSAASVDTDASGHASVTWTGTTAATVTGQSGDVTGRAQIVLGSVPPPASPTPFLGVNLTATPASVEIGEHVTLTAKVQTVGDVGALTFAWDVDGDGAIDSTSGASSIGASYTKSGILTPTVTVTSTNGLHAFAYGTIAVR